MNMSNMNIADAVPEKSHDADVGAVDRRGIGGYDTVDKLVKALLCLRGDVSMDADEVKCIVKCWNGLFDYDKKPLVFTKSPVNRKAKGQTKRRSLAHKYVVMPRMTHTCCQLFNFLMYSQIHSSLQASLSL